MHKVTFWILAYLVHDPPLLEAIRAETMPGVADDRPNVPYLTEQCSLLESVFLEVLRLKMSSSLMRYVTEETVIAGKTMRKGNTVMVPYRQLHYDEDVWGPNPSIFDPHRFLRDKGLARSPSYRPFGGGQHLCPGRFLARQAIFTFLALALSRLDIALDAADCALEQPGGECSSRFPRTDESKPGLGTLGPVVGDVVMLRVKPRGGA